MLLKETEEDTTALLKILFTAVMSSLPFKRIIVVDYNTNFHFVNAFLKFYTIWLIIKAASCIISEILQHYSRLFYSHVIFFSYGILDIILSLFKIGSVKAKKIYINAVSKGSIITFLGILKTNNSQKPLFIKIAGHKLFKNTFVTRFTVNLQRNRRFTESLAL